MSDRLAERLEIRLADLGGSLAYPAPAPDFASRVGDRLRSPAAVGWWGRLGGRPIRRSLLVAVAALLLAVAAVAAAGIALPGLRIIFVGPDATVAPSEGPAASVASPERHTGSSLGLGAAMEADEAARVAGFDLLLPSGLGAPDEVFVLNRRATLLWRARPDLPEMRTTGTGLLVTEFIGTVDDGYYEKQVDSGQTTVEPVEIGDDHGLWLSGEPHAFVYVDESGAFVQETRRLVGDVLIWQRGELTLRIESALGRDATIALAETLRP